MAVKAKAAPVKAVTVSLGGRDRPLVCDYAALERLEEALGTPIFDDGLITRLIDSPKASDLRLMLWAFQAEDDDPLSLEDVGQALNLRNTAAALGAMRAAWNEAFTDPNVQPEEATTDAGEEPTQPTGDG